MEPILLHNRLSSPQFVGGNRGHEFEVKTINELYQYLNDSSLKKSPAFSHIKSLLNMMKRANPRFRPEDIVEVDFRTGTTVKTGVRISDLGEIIGDCVMKDITGKYWYISLKNIDGNTFSTFPGISTLFSGDTIQPSSAGAEFLRTFGVDLNILQSKFDELTNNKHRKRRSYKVEDSKPIKTKRLLEFAWGQNYFYVRQKSGNSWKVFWLSGSMLNNLTSSIKVEDIRYPHKNSKQITILCGNSHMQYIIEVRNTSGGIYPNKALFKVRYK